MPDIPPSDDPTKPIPGVPPAGLKATSSSFPVPDVSGKGWPPGGTTTGTGTPRITDDPTAPGEDPPHHSGTYEQPGGTIVDKPPGEADVLEPVHLGEDGGHHAEPHAANAEHHDEHKD